MQSIGEVLEETMQAIGTVAHMPLSEKDYIDDNDGYVHCGVCGEKKEFLLPFNERFVPCMCRCQRDKAREEEEERKRKQELQRVSELASYSLVDERFRESTFDKYIPDSPEDENVLKLCKNYVERFDEMQKLNVGLIFYGKPGTGKTFAASCIANALMDKGIPVLVTSVVRLTNGVFGDELHELLDKMNTARLLVLDDLGAERNTDFKAEQLFTVIDSRYAAKKPMIITTNTTDFKNESDMRRVRIYDRIFEVCAPVKMNGESRRRKRLKENRDLTKLILGDES